LAGAPERTRTGCGRGARACDLGKARDPDWREPHAARDHHHR
jgi:hypothetical protein